MKVKDVMTTNVACVCCDDPLSFAAQLMWDRDCGSIPVTDAGGERIVGMVTDRDICIAAWSKDSAPSSIKTSEAMSKTLYTVAPEDSVANAENLMLSRQVRRVPVIDAAQRLVGILSLADIASASRRIGPRTAESEIAPAAIAATLAGISRPRADSQPQLLASALG
jgi:CBS domain-containing protein